MAKETKPLIRVHNTLTNEVVDREMNDEEFTLHLQEIAEREALDLAEQAKAQAKADALAALGLTEEQLQALLG